MTAPGRSRPLRTLVLCGTPVTLVALLLALACTGEPTRTNAGPQDSRSSVALGSLVADGAGQDISTQGALAGHLPSTDTVTSSVPAFEIKQKGGGIAGRFEITNPSSAAIALDGVSSGSGHALLAWNLGLGRGAVVITSNSNNTLPALDVSSQSLGTSTLAAAADIRANNPSAAAPAANITTLGTGNGLQVKINNSANRQPALLATTNGQGPAARFEILNAASTAPSALLAVDTVGKGPAAVFRARTASGNSAVIIANAGTGRGLTVNHTGTSGDLAALQVGGVNKARIDRTGRGFFNGGTQTGGADVAEAFAVEGTPRAYEPGDVLVISTHGDRRVTKSDEPYSTRVAGVYATKPGVLLTEQDIDDSLGEMVPLGVVGVIPTKVSAENGAIRRGDLLVTARTPGHAMRADPDRLRVGMSIGKALEEFAGPGTGVIQVLVNVK